MSVLDDVAQAIRDHEREINTARYELEQAQQSGEASRVKLAKKRVRKLEAARMKLFSRANKARKNEQRRN